MNQNNLETLKHGSLVKAPFKPSRPSHNFLVEQSFEENHPCFAFARPKNVMHKMCNGFAYLAKLPVSTVAEVNCKIADFLTRIFSLENDNCKIGALQPTPVSSWCLEPLNRKSLF